MWTATALASEARPYPRATAWRVVEAQHQGATLRLADSLAEQALLEDILEASKPPYPPGADRLHDLLKTPFRYRPSHPHGSRFRRCHARDGVFYAAEALATALAETAFYRLRFFMAAPQAPLPRGPVSHTAFAVAVSAERALDLMSPPLVADRAQWVERDDYTATQALGEAARGAGIGIIRYASVRDPEGRANLALLDPAAFAEAEPLERQTWESQILALEVVLWRPSGGQAMAFSRSRLMGGDSSASAPRAGGLASQGG